VYEKHLHISITRYFDIKPSVLKDFKLLELKVTSLTGIHTLTIYRNQEDKFSHALHFLKEGLENNESIVLITDYLSKEKVLDVMRDLWETDYVDTLYKDGDITIVTTAEWYFRGHYMKINNEKVMKCWNDVTDKAKQRGKRGLRAFGDVRLFFEHGLTDELISYELEFHRKPYFSLKIICAYLESEIISLPPQLSEALQRHHKHVYLVP
jgi:hypothetical protein